MIEIVEALNCYSTFINLNKLKLDDTAISAIPKYMNQYIIPLPLTLQWKSL